MLSTIAVNVVSLQQFLGQSWVAVSALLRRWFAVDLRSLAAFRMALASVIWIDLIARARFIDDYSEHGVLPRVLLSKFPIPYWFELHTFSGTPVGVWVLFFAQGLAASALFVGCFTRAATIACWWLVSSLQWRNSYFLDGGDVLLRLLLFWSLFLPLGARWSLDARQRSARELAVFSPASVGLLLQFVLLYVFAGINKTSADWGEDATAIEWVLRDSYWVKPLGEALLNYPLLLSLATPAVVWCEVFGACLLFAPCWTARLRLVGIGLFLGFQFGLWLTIQLNLFSWIASALALPFLPSVFWERFASTAAGDSRTSLGSPPEAAETQVGALNGLLLKEQLAKQAASSPLTHERATGRKSPRFRRAFDAAAFAGHVVVALFVGLAVLLNMDRCGWIQLPRRVHAVVGGLGVEQDWWLYAPGPTHATYHFELRGTLSDGRQLDLMADAVPPEFITVQEAHRSYRFKYYMERDKPRAMNQAYVNWLCWRWNNTQSSLPQLMQVNYSRWYTAIHLGERAPSAVAVQQSNVALRCPSRG